VTAKFWGDPASVSQSARIVPRFVDGQPRGFKLYGLRPGTVLGQLGLENGDVVVGVNGKELTSPESALAVYMECKDAALLTLALERKDQPLVRRIRFERRPLAAGECPPLAQPTEQPAAPPSVVAAKTVSPRNRELSPPAALRNIAQDITCKATRCTLRNGVGDRILANTNLLATSARIVPTVEGGTVIGFKLFAIRAGSVLALLGLKNGDVVRTINDYELSAPDKALEAYTKLRQASELRVRVDRNGAPLVLVYVVKR
jgi:type II secretory pathway component PulC